VSGHEKNYQYLRETGQQLVAASLTDELRSDVDSLQRWHVLVDAVNKRVDLCRATIEQLRHYEVPLI